MFNLICCLVVSLLVILFNEYRKLARKLWDEDMNERLLKERYKLELDNIGNALTGKKYVGYKVTMRDGSFDLPPVDPRVGVELKKDGNGKIIKYLGGRRKQYLVEFNYGKQLPNSLIPLCLYNTKSYEKYQIKEK